jgi:hypothetical protein
MLGPVNASIMAEGQGLLHPSPGYEVPSRLYSSAETEIRGG